MVEAIKILLFKTHLNPRKKNLSGIIHEHIKMLDTTKS